MNTLLGRRGNMIRFQQHIKNNGVVRHHIEKYKKPNIMQHTVRPYIFFEPTRHIKQIVQNCRLLLDQKYQQGMDTSSTTNKMLQGKQIMIRLKNNSKEQMRAVYALMKRNKNRLINNALANDHSAIPSLGNPRILIKKASRTYYEKGRVRFRKLKQNIKHSSFSRYYHKKRRHISHHYRYKALRQHLKSNLRQISSSYHIEKLMNGRILSSLMPRQLPQKTKQIDEKFAKYKSKLKMIKDWVLYSNHAVTLDEPFQKEWFTEHGYPLTSRDPQSGRFVNPWQSQSTNGWKRLVDVWEWKKTRMIGYDMKHSLKEKEKYTANTNSLENMNQDPCSIAEQLSPPSAHDKIKMTWIGHASMLVQQSGFTILTDPVFSVKASPVQSFEDTEFLGVPRLSPPSFTIDDIPPSGVDICLISHDHYDHLDFNSVLQLNERQLVQHWVVPLGFKDWLTKEAGVDTHQITELEWWQSVQFENNGYEYFSPANKIRQIGAIESVLGNSSTDSKATEVANNEQTASVEDVNMFGNNIRITCAPAQHWCARSAVDRNSRLWCSWAIHSSSKTSLTGKKSSQGELSFYFAGDTAYPTSFPLHRLIGEALGPFDLASIPIGAYAPTFFMRDSHCNPFESVKIHSDTRSKKSVAIHHSTFPLANEPVDEPMVLLKKAVYEEKRKGRVVDFVGIPLGICIES